MHSSKVSFSQVFSGFKHGSSCEQTKDIYVHMYVHLKIDV